MVSQLFPGSFKKQTKFISLIRQMKELDTVQKENFTLYSQASPILHESHVPSTSTEQFPSVFEIQKRLENKEQCHKDSTDKIVRVLQESLAQYTLKSSSSPTRMDKFIYKAPLCRPEQAAELTNSILNMMVTDMHPLSMVEDAESPAAYAKEATPFFDSDTTTSDENQDEEMQLNAVEQEILMYFGEHPLSKKENPDLVGKECSTLSNIGRTGKVSAVYSSYIHTIRASVFSCRRNHPLHTPLFNYSIPVAGKRSSVRGELLL
ncbi:hypothetical protein SRHO_G00216040 [Serrasalmus rhombeus]